MTLSLPRQSAPDGAAAGAANVVPPKDSGESKKNQQNSGPDLPPEEKLLPCPFCGSVPRVVLADDEKSVECVACGAASCIGSESQTIAAWNRRAQQSGPLASARLYNAALALMDDVRRRYPGEKLRCPLMRELDAAIGANERHGRPNDQKDAARYRWLRDHGDTEDWENIGWDSDKDAAIDVLMGSGRRIICSGCGVPLRGYVHGDPVDCLKCGNMETAMWSSECNCGGTSAHLLSCPLNPANSMLKASP